MKIFGLFILMLVIFSCKNQSTTQQHKDFSQKDATYFEQQLFNLAKELKTSELSYAVVDNSKILYMGHLGEKDEKSNFSLSNFSSIFTSTILYQLSEKEGVDIKLKYPNYFNDPVFKKRNLRQLMSFIDDKNENFNFQVTDLKGQIEFIENFTSKKFSDIFTERIGELAEMDQTQVLLDSGEYKINSSVRDLARFSIAYDNGRFFNSTTQKNLERPVYLSNGQLNPSGTGWFVQFYNNKKFLWNFGYGYGVSSLIIKSTTDSVSLIVLANSEMLNRTFKLEKGNLWHSPVAMNFLKCFILPEEKMPFFEFQTGIDTLKKALIIAKNSSHKNILVSEFLNYVHAFQTVRDTAKENLFLKVYKEVLPNDIPVNLAQKEPYVSIDQVSDFIHYKKKFEIQHDTVLEVLAVGEIKKELSLSIWDYDNIELFFDASNSKSASFNNKIHQQYRFNYDLADSISGNFTSSKNIRFKQSDPAKNKYFFEIAISWKTINNKNVKSGKRIGFDVSASDNDGTKRKNYISWHFQKDEKAWESPAFFGQIFLAENSSQQPSDSIYYSNKVDKVLNIDGNPDILWNKSLFCSLNRTTFDTFPKPEDFSVKFKSLWDAENIYFLFEVRDDKKLNLPEGIDYGWIEDQNNDTVWKMDVHKAAYAGGDHGNRFVHQKIKLKKGAYTLHYQTNQTNSYFHWEGKRPDFSFYGISLY